MFSVLLDLQFEVVKQVFLEDCNLLHVEKILQKNAVLTAVFF